jgi:small-conductance mechanosensitive channel
MAAPQANRGLSRNRLPRGAARRRGKGARGVGRRRVPGGTAGARSTLRHFRQATILAVAITAFLLMLLGGGEEGAAQADPLPTGPAQPAAQVEQVPDTVAIIEPVATDDLLAQTQEEAEEEEEVLPDDLVREAADEARRTIRNLWYGFLGNLPKFFVSALILLLAAGAVRIVRPLMVRVFGHWEKSNALTALTGIAIWLFAIGVVVSVLAGDIRALVGSLGLIGLALSWALQTPIESFTGWLMNSFQGYYRVGDRVSVGEVFGDVYKIDFLTTTVWEIGSPERGGFVRAEQPTGRLITFPNSEVLAGSIVNLTRDFPFVWDEMTVPVGNRSDLAYASEVIRGVASRVLSDYMEEPARMYESILRSAGLELHVPAEVQVFVSLDDSWTNLTVRYLVAARERRKWASALAQAVMTEFNKPEHEERIRPVFPRRQIQMIGPDGKAREPWPPESANHR